MLHASLKGQRTPDSYLRNYESMVIAPDGGSMQVYFSTIAGNRTIQLDQQDVVSLLARDFERLSNNLLQGLERDRVLNEYTQLLRCAGDFGPEIDPKVKNATRFPLDVTDQNSPAAGAAYAETVEFTAHLLASSRISPS